MGPPDDYLRRNLPGARAVDYFCAASFYDNSGSSILLSINMDPYNHCFCSLLLFLQFPAPYRWKEMVPPKQGLLIKTIG